MRTLQINIHEDLGRTVLSSKIELEKANFIISKNKYSLKPNQTIFISKNCSIPKAKLRTVMMSHNLKVTKNFKEADVCFIDPSPSALARISESASCYTIINDVEKIVDCFRYFMVDEGLDLYRLKDTDIDILENHIKEGEKIIVDYKNLNQIKRFCNIDNKDYRYDYSTYLKEGTDYECYEYFLDNKIVVYNHQDLMEILNGKDALVIEKKEYEQLKSMIESSDEDNLLLAMEMMANCDYTKSLLYLCMLFENYQESFTKNRYSRHINFKSLLAYLKVDRYTNVTIDYMMDLFIERKVLNKEWVDIIFEEYAARIANRESKHFKAKVITLNTEALEFLNFNYDQKIVEDFVPVEKEVEEEEEVLNNKSISNIVWS
jgi:hypothetical protein